MELKSTAGLNKTLEEIKKGKLVPVYLVYGDEDYLIKEAAQKLIETLLSKKDGPGLEIFEGDEDWDRVILSLNTYPFLGTKRVVWVRDTEIFYSRFGVEEVLEKSLREFERGKGNEAVRLFRMALGYLKIEEVNDEVGSKLEDLLNPRSGAENKKWVQKMVEDCLRQGLGPILHQDHSDKLNHALSKGIPRNNLLVLCPGSVDKRKRLYKTINELGIILDFSIQRMRRDPGEIEEEEKKTLGQQANELLRKSGKTFSKGAFEALANKTGYNVGVFLNELEKVILSVEDRGKIEIQDIEEIVGRTKEDSVFDLQKAVGQRNLERALFSLKELLGQGEFYLNLLQSIASEIRFLIAAKQVIENELKAKWNPKQDLETFKRVVYFPIILKLRKEREKELPQRGGRYNIFKLPPDVLVELLKSSDNFSREELYRFMKLLAETDLKTKTTGLTPARLLEKALVEICGRSR